MDDNAISRFGLSKFTNLSGNSFPEKESATRITAIISDPQWQMADGIGLETAMSYYQQLVQAACFYLLGSEPGQAMFSVDEAGS